MNTKRGFPSEALASKLVEEDAPSNDAEAHPHNLEQGDDQATVYMRNASLSRCTQNSDVTTAPTKTK